MRVYDDFYNLSSTAVYTCPTTVGGEDVLFYDIQLVGYNASATPPYWIVK